MPNKPVNTNFWYGTDVATSILGVSQQVQLPNIGAGGQLGFGGNFPMLDVATPAVFIPTVLVVLSTPDMYPADHPMTHLIKEMIEQLPKTVSGIDFGYQLATGESIAGRDGQNLAVPTKSTRSAVSPSFTFQELNGNIIWNVIRKWIWDISHPDTDVSQGQIENPGAYVMSTYAMTMMAIQFDPTMRPDHIIDAAIYTNMFPTNTGDIGFERTIGTNKTMERSISFTAIVQHNPYIKTLAKAIASQLKLHTVNYDLATPTRTEVSKTLTNMGLAAAMKEGPEAWAKSNRNNW